MLKLSAAVLGLAITAVPAAPQTPPTAQRFTLSGNMLRGYAALQRNLVEAAELLPDEHYGYKPTAETRPYGQLVAHIALSQFGGCAALKGEPNPRASEKEEAPRSKADLVALLKSSIAYCEQTAKPTTCESVEHRQFDFWVGEWDVTTPDGKPAGRNSITRELKSCVIHEHWAGSGGMTGESFNMWDAVKKRWHQTWVSDNGNLLLLDGAFQNGSMVLTGMSGPPERQVMNRITWTQGTDGSVRQHWEASPDGGKTWKTAFDGIYRRAKGR